MRVQALRSRRLQQEKLLRTITKIYFFTHTHIFVETVIHFIFQDSLMNRKFKRTAFAIEIICNIINVFTFNFDKFNASFLNECVYIYIYFFYKILVFSHF